MNLPKITLGLMICLISLKGLTRTSDIQNTGDPSAVMLKDFYIAYTTAWCTVTGDVLIKKLDSLQSKYCTIAYRKELKKEFKKVGLDHDELVNDAATDVEHLNTLKILKDPKKANEYIVSYMVFGKDVSKNPLTEKIVMHVLVTKESGNYKIAAVKNGSYTIIPNK
jgi:hypothetical protein